jgi:hypothetical protein
MKFQHYGGKEAKACGDDGLVLVLLHEHATCYEHASSDFTR